MVSMYNSSLECPSRCSKHHHVALLRDWSITSHDEFVTIDHFRDNYYRIEVNLWRWDPWLADASPVEMIRVAESAVVAVSVSTSDSNYSPSSSSFPSFSSATSSMHSTPASDDSRARLRPLRSCHLQLATSQRKQNHRRCTHIDR